MRELINPPFAPPPRHASAEERWDQPNPWSGTAPGRNWLRIDALSTIVVEEFGLDSRPLTRKIEKIIREIRIRGRHFTALETALDRGLGTITARKDAVFAAGTTAWGFLWTGNGACPSAYFPFSRRVYYSLPLLRQMPRRLLGHAAALPILCALTAGEDDLGEASRTVFHRRVSQLMSEFGFPPEEYDAGCKSLAMVDSQDSVDAWMGFEGTRGRALVNKYQVETKEKERGIR